MRRIIGARSGGAVVAAARFHPLGVKFPYRGVIGRAECDVRAGAGWPLVQIQPKRRLALGSEARTTRVARAQDIAEWRQRRDIEIDALVEVADFDSNVVVHGDLQSIDTGSAPREGWRSS
jgi:hypothetical protein